MARPATPSKPLHGKIPDRRRTWYPVSLLALQSNRSVNEIVGWIESGKLRGASTSDGWMVHRDQLDTWRELCDQPRLVYRSMRALLKAHPELQAIRDEMNSAVFAKPDYDKARHEAAKAEWDAALDRLGIVYETGDPSFGFMRHSVLPDPDEPGFDPVDQKYASPQEMEVEHR